MTDNTTAPELPDFNLPEVQAVYETLCGAEPPPAGEHWDGWVSRHIVLALRKLRAPVAGHQPYPAMPEPDVPRHGEQEESYSREAVENAMRTAHDRGYSVGWDHGKEHASVPVAGEALGWRVRERRGRDGELLDCFVEAPAAPGMAYAQEVLGDDYAEAQGGIEGKLKHCQMIVAWANGSQQGGAR